MKQKNVLLLLVLALALASLGLNVYLFSSRVVSPETEGAAVVNGLDFTKIEENLTQYQDEIKLMTPLPGQTVTNGFVIKGQTAKWFFEGDFSYTLYTVNGFVITTGILKGSDDWFEPGFHDFNGVINYKYKPDCQQAILVIEEDNPGLPACQVPKRLYVPVVLQ